MIHERLGRYEMRCRLTGTAIDEMFGKNYTHGNLFDLYDPGDHEFFSQLHDDLLHTPCGARSQRSVLMPTGKNFDIAGIHLPMADDTCKPVYLMTLLGPKATHMPGGAKPGESSIITLEKSIEYLDLGYGLPANR